MFQNEDNVTLNTGIRRDACSKIEGVEGTFKTSNSSFFFISFSLGYYLEPGYYLQLHLLQYDVIQDLSRKVANCAVKFDTRSIQVGTKVDLAAMEAAEVG